MGHGRPKGKTADKTLILDYRTWIIEYDGSAWPSDCYILKKKGVRSVAYCSNLENALKTMYNSMLADYVNRQNDYGAKFEDLANAIIGTKNDFSKILDNPQIVNCIKMNKNENKEGLKQ